MKKYDVIVIGGGSGGMGFANRASRRGAKVALFEKRLMGGTCVNDGCVPKKVMWYAADLIFKNENHAENYGLTNLSYDLDYTKFKASRDAYVDRARNGNANAVKNNGVDTYEGYATFVDKNTVEVDGELFQAEHIVIASGARPLMPNFKGIELASTSTDFFEWEDLPKSVVIVGAGYIGVELAFTMSSFGVDVTLVHNHSTPLNRFDHLITEEIMTALEDSGIHFVPSVYAEGLQENEGMIEVLVDGEVVAQGERALMTIGRVPNTEHLNLEAAGIELLPSGHIAIDENHQTSQANIYAVGDVTTNIPLTPAAIQGGRAIAEFLYGEAPSASFDYSKVPTVVFSHPAIGSMGLTEKEAIEKYGADEINTYPITMFPMSNSAGGVRVVNKAKFITQGPDEVIVGFHAIGEPMDETLQLIALAMNMGATRKDFHNVVAVHPSITEDLFYF